MNTISCRPVPFDVPVGASGHSMLRFALVICLVILTGVPELSAQAKIGSLEPLEQFDDYPRNEGVGAKGHVARGECFTGRWYLAAVTAGVLGEPKHVPLLTHSRLPVTEQRVVAIAAVDLESESRLCLKIKPECQPAWETEFDFRILAKDVVCFLARKPAKGTEGDECYLVTVSLSTETIAVEQLSRTSAECLLQSRWCDGQSVPQPEAPGDRHFEQRVGSPNSPLGGGSLANDEIDLRGARKPCRLASPGSRRGRLIQCDLIGPGQFCISEHDGVADRRQYWRLSEAPFEASLPKNHSKVARLYFPHILVAPVSNFILAAAAEGSTPALFTISDGQLRKLWNAPVGYEISSLELSENESHAAVELHGDVHLESRTMTSGIELSTGRAMVYSNLKGEWDDLFIVGVTNRGELVQKGAGAVFIRRGSGDPLKIAQLIRDRD